MIQELLGGEKCIGEERKMANVNLRESGSSSSSDHHQLRCPRCDSPNTKFCYYNNYNLTQPRHFCKTCRRYWTKGGVLRNVPIGGVCRKNKTSGSSTKSTKIKSEPPKHNPVIGLDHGTVPPSMASPFLWGSPANSQLLDLQFPAVASSQHALSLALLRVSIQNPNPNSCFNPNPVLVKEEGLMIGSQQLMSEPGVLNSQTLTLDPVGGGSLWRSNNNQQQGLFAGEVQSGGIQELYQRLRASANLCNSDQNSHTNTHHQALNSALDPTPLPSTELGYWNSPLSWSDLHTSNGGFP